MDAADVLIDWARAEQTVRTTSRVFVGIETEAPSDGVPPKVTFADMSLDQMNAEFGYRFAVQ
jgi:hypothetical protein